MTYTYDRSPGGDKLTITRCDEGHVNLIVTSFSGKTTVPVCIADTDVTEVTREMRAWARPADGPTVDDKLAAYRQADWELGALRTEIQRLETYREHLANAIAALDAKASK